MKEIRRRTAIFYYMERRINKKRKYEKQYRQIKKICEMHKK